MVRIKTNVYSHKRKKRILKEAKGQWGDRSKRYKEAIKSLMAARQYSFYDRRKKKGDFRALWIVRLNAACRESGISYSRFINGLKRANITLDRKILSEMAISAPEAFAQIVETAKNAPAAKAQAAVVDTTKKVAKTAPTKKEKKATDLKFRKDRQTAAPKKTAAKAKAKA
jgi:large subunit ribosomal protein L20